MLPITPPRTSLIEMLSYGLPSIDILAGLTANMSRSKGIQEKIHFALMINKLNDEIYFWSSVIKTIHNFNAF